MDSVSDPDSLNPDPAFLINQSGQAGRGQWPLDWESKIRRGSFKAMRENNKIGRKKIVLRTV